MSVIRDSDLKLLEIETPNDDYCEYYVCTRISAENEDIIYHCDLCSKAFQHLSSFLLKCSHHTQTDASDFCFICDLCAICFKYKSDLANHLRKHQKDRRFVQSANFVCQFCLRAFTSSRDLCLHELEHNGFLPQRRTSGHICNLCPFKTKSKQTLQSHLSRKHSIENNGKKKYTCQHCQQQFTSELKWRSHDKYHDMTLNAQDIKCTVCDKKMKTKQYLMQHMRVHEEKSLKCPHEGCPAKFNLTQSLKRHVRIMHEKVELELKCRYCDEIYRSSATRLYHESKMHDVPSCFNKTKALKHKGHLAISLSGHPQFSKSIKKNCKTVRYYQNFVISKSYGYRGFFLQMHSKY